MSIKKLEKCEACGKMSLDRFVVCKMCNRWVCPEYVEVIEDHAYFTDYICKECWEIGIPYREKIGALEEDIEKVETEWAGKCRGSR